MQGQEEEEGQDGRWYKVQSEHRSEVLLAFVGRVAVAWMTERGAESGRGTETRAKERKDLPMRPSFRELDRG